MIRVWYVELDVSLETTSVCVIDADSGLILEAKAGSEPFDIGEVLAPSNGLALRPALVSVALQWAREYRLARGLH
ncbi:MAG: hypothetical protein AAGF50_05415 [Pseudomonadota bacterium]